MFNRGRATRISYDHKPSDPREELRIRCHGDYVYPNLRLNNNISVCRGMGDHYIGTSFSCAPFVSILKLGNLLDYCVSSPMDADPKKPKLQDNELVIILACDGVWDVVSDQQAGAIVADVLAGGGTCEHAATVLRDMAFALGSDDNISVIVTLVQL